MTNKEAINKLTAVLNDDIYSWSPAILTAFDMAVDALKGADGDCISRQVVKDALADTSLLEWEQLKKCFPMLEVVDEAPSAQPDIIACGDCKHWICHDRRCGFWNHGVKSLDWCSYAERRTDA